MYYIDGNKFREKSSSGSIVAVLDGDKIREKSSSGSVITTMDKIKKEFKNPIGGKSLVAFWTAFIK